MALLGDDGRGYELARRLECYGVWRTWLGDSCYSNFVQFLSSPSMWDSFMRVDDSKSRAQIQLQLRARALLFDKATVSLFLRSTNSSTPSSSLSVSKLNPAYLQLHGDDIYFTLENTSQDGDAREGTAASNTASSKIQAKSSSAIGSRYNDSEFDAISQRYRKEDLPETWYNQFIEKYRVNKPYKLSFGERELGKRTPEEMSAYIRCITNHKKRCLAFKEDHYAGLPSLMPENASNMLLDGGNTVSEDSSIFPELMFTMNCVPESALPPTRRDEDSKKIEFHGVLDSLPQLMTRSPVLIERLGIKPESLGMEKGGNMSRTRIGSEGNRKLLAQEQALELSQKVVVKMLIGVGFEVAREVPVEVFSQMLGCHICKLGQTLKILTDNYRKQCSAIELIKMFLRTVGYGNLMPLAETVKDSSRNFAQQTQQVHAVPSQFQSQHQNSLRLPQQIPRQMHSQVQQIINSNLAFQQQQQQLQLDRMRRRQPSTPRPAEMDKERPLVQVKIENQEVPIDSNVFNTINARHPQMQFRQQSMASLAGLHNQSGNQFRQTLPMPQIQSPNMGMVRTQPVKVEGFQELMGGDSSSKHEAEENRLMSPSSK